MSNIFLDTFGPYDVKAYLTDSGNIGRVVVTDALGSPIEIGRLRNAYRVAIKSKLADKIETLKREQELA